MKVTTMTSVLGAAPYRKVSKVVLALHVVLTSGNYVSAFLVGNHDISGSTTSRRRHSDNPLSTILSREHEILTLKDANCSFNPGEDRQRTRASCPRSDVGHEYTLEANSDPNIKKSCRFTEKQIHALIAKRLEFKKARNFTDADRVLKGLNMNGIFLQDKQRKYRVDGENHFGRKERYIQRGPSYGVGPKDLSLIANMVEERARYKRMREYHVSDDITEKLKLKFGVKVNDKKREWSIVIASNHLDGTVESTEDYYVPTQLAPADHPTHTMDDDVKNIIRDRLRYRFTARRNKKYEEADRIRDELVEEYSIVIDDRTKEWKVVDEDNDKEDDLFVNEARLSQRSAFARQGQERKEESRDVQFDSDEYYRKNGNANNGPGVDYDTESFIASSIIHDTKDRTGPITKAAVEVSNELATMTVVALKDKLREAGLPISGKKAELIDRLLSSGI